MADTKISQLPVAGSITGTELVPLVQGGATKQTTVASIVASAGGVTSVTGTAPVVSSGGATPAISMAAATTSVSGYLTSTDWTTFNNKQPAGSYLTSGGALGTPSSGTATNLTGLPLTTGVTGLLPIANGGTGTATPSLVAGTNVTLSGTWPNQTVNATAGGSGTVTSVAATVPSFLSVTGSPITTSGTLALSYSGTALPVLNGGTGVTTSTGTGSTVLSTSPTLVTPALGTPSALVGTNITGTASGLTAGTVTTNANLTGGVTSVGNAATVVTNANLTGAVTSVGNATSLGSFTSAQLATALTDETGSGANVFATSPTLVTPLLGTPTSGNFSTGTFTWPTFNQNTSGTAAGLSATLVVGSGGTGLTSVGTSGNVLTSNGTAWTSTALPASVSLSAANTWTGTQTFNGTSSTFGAILLDSAETVNVVAAAPSATTNFYVQSGSVQLYTTSAANNWTLNIAFSSGTSMNTALATGQSVTFTLVTTQGSTAYYNNAVTIDGTSVTPQWIGGAPTAGNASGLDVYRMACIKTGSATYTVLASLTQYK